MFMLVTYTANVEAAWKFFNMQTVSEIYKFDSSLNFVSVSMKVQKLMWKLTAMEQ